jgi:hypothetical protein
VLVKLLYAFYVCVRDGKPDHHSSSMAFISDNFPVVGWLVGW